MRLALTAMILAGLAAPAMAQQLSPLTGTTATPPATNATVPPALTTPPAAGAPATTPTRRARATLQQRFDEANTTHDGKLTLEQAKAAKMRQVARHFDAIDSGKKGYVTVDDIRAYRAAQREAHRAAASSKPQ